MKLMDYINLIIVLANVFLGFFIYLKNPKNKLYRAFFILALSFSFWVFAAWQAGRINEGNIPLIWERLSFTAGALMASCFLYFNLIFTEKKKSLLFNLLVLFVLPIISIITTLTPYVVSEAHRTNLGYDVSYGFLWYIFTIYFIIYVLAGFIVLIQKYKNSTGILRLRTKYLFIGLFLMAFFGIVFNLIIPFFVSIDILQDNHIFHFFFHFSHFASLFFIGFTAYAIVRYRLMDIKVVIRKGLVYGLSLTISFALYTYLALILKSTIEKSWNISPAWTAFILVGLVAIGFPPLKSLVEKLINSVFRGKQSIDLAVKEVRKKIAKRKDLEALIDLISEEIKKYLEIKQAKIYIIDRKEQQFVCSNAEEEREALSLSSDLVRYFEKYSDALVRDEIEHLIEEQQGRFEKEILHKAEKEMKKHKFTLALPLKTEDEIFGIIALGERQNSQTYTVQDVQFLEQLREQVNFTLANAVLYRDTIERVRQTYGEYTID